MHTPPEITAETIRLWLEKAVQEITGTMFSIGAYPAEAPSGPTDQAEVLAACIGVRGHFPLEVALFFPPSLAAQLACISLEVSATDLDEKMVNDVAGEFSNMVVGAVKSRISDMHVDCSMTVPRTMRGTDHSTDFWQKIQAAFAVIRGAAGPRNDATSTRTVAHFNIGNEVMRLESHF